MQELLSLFADYIEGITLIPGDGGIFDLTLNGQPLYSKKQTKRFPEIAELAGAIQKHLD